MAIRNKKQKTSRLFVPFFVVNLGWPSYIANTPGNSALLACGRGLVSLAGNAYNINNRPYGKVKGEGGLVQILSSLEHKKALPLIDKTTQGPIIRANK